METNRLIGIALVLISFGIAGCGVIDSDSRKEKYAYNGEYGFPDKLLTIDFPRWHLALDGDPQIHLSGSVGETVTEVDTSISVKTTVSIISSDTSIVTQKITRLEVSSAKSIWLNGDTTEFPVDDLSSIGIENRECWFVSATLYNSSSEAPGEPVRGYAFWLKRDEAE